MSLYPPSTGAWVMSNDMFFKQPTTTTTPIVVVVASTAAAMATQQLPVPIVIAFSGFAGAGKDAAADVLVRLYGFERLAFADAIRDMTSAINPLLTFHDDGHVERYNDIVSYYTSLDDAKRYVPSIREFLVALGSSVRATLGESTFIDIVVKKATKLMGCDDDNNPGHGGSHGHSVAVSDCRYRGERDALCALGGTTILITRPGVTAANATERASLADFDPDFEIINDGTLQDLENAIKRVVDKIVASANSA